MAHLIQEKAKPKDDSAVKRIQEIGKREAEKNKKKKEEKAPAESPAQGVFGRMRELLGGKPKEKK